MSETLVKNVPFVHSPWPDCVVQLMSYDDAAPEFPGTHGTGFFAKMDEHIFLLTARHCMGKIGADLAYTAARLMIPYESSTGQSSLGDEDYVQFGSIGRAVVKTDLNAYVGYNAGDLDIVALEAVLPHNLASERLRQRSVQLPPKGQWFERVVRAFESTEEDLVVRIRGFPKNGTKSSIDYDSHHVVQQCATLQARYSGPGPYPHTKSARILDTDTISDIDGMSGSPVYMHVPSAPEAYALVGMVQNGHMPTFHFATVEWLSHAVEVALQTPTAQTAKRPF